MTKNRNQRTQLYQIKAMRPSAQACEDCLAVHDNWMHLRPGRTCGILGCGKDSHNRQAHTLFMHAKQLLMSALEPKEARSRCCIDPLEVSCA